MEDASSSSEQRILTRLGLARLAIVDQLVLVLKRFRAAQLRDLEDALNVLPTSVCRHIEAYFDRKLDVKDELERYVQDLLNATHVMRHLSIEGDLQRDVMALFGALGDSRDRALLLKMLQTLGAKLMRVLCDVCQRLEHISLQQDFYRVFGVTDTGLADLKAWMQWLESLYSSPSVDTVLHFLVQCTQERCLALWLTLLGPVASVTRVLLIEKLVTLNDSALLKQIARFHDVTTLPVIKFLDLCATFRALLSMLLRELPMATALTLYAKFNDDRLIASLEKMLTLLHKDDVVRLVDTLAMQENTRAIQVFVIPLVAYARRQAIASLFLALLKPSQAQLLDLLLRADDTNGQIDNAHFPHSITVFTFLLDGQLHSTDDMLYKLWSMPSSSFAGVVKAMKHYTSEELVLLTEGIEALAHASCLDGFFRLFELVPPSQRGMLVAWVLDAPGENALPLYDILVSLYASPQAAKAFSVLQMAASLTKSDKHVLCSQLLRTVNATAADKATDADMNTRIVFFLCGREPTQRHEAVKLFAAIDADAYDSLLYLLQTQRVPEQVALTKLMLGLSNSANGRLLGKVQALSTETLDEFFQLLLLIPKVEYKSLARLLVSRDVSVAQFQDFVHVAANMMNQAASRELLIFAAELPVHYRNVFFAVTAECGTAERGVLMRIVACSTRLARDVLHLFVELLIRIPWETRSALVEQLRSLEDATQIQNYVVVLREFANNSCLARLIHLLNLLPLPVRIAMVSVFRQVPCGPERVQALAKLDVMPKDTMPAYCRALCDAACLPFISGPYLRVFGYLQQEFHTKMLQLLAWRACWVFIQLLADSITDQAPAAPSSMDDTSSSNSALVNGLAASLTLLKTEDDCILLGDVMEEALANGIRLEELIVVFAHFRDHAQLLAFLKYVAQLTMCARSTLLFRVLSRSHAAAFLFSMCHALDLDDALFALKRLDRMWQRDAQRIGELLTVIAQKSSAIDARDEFCDLVLGYREKTSSNASIPRKGDQFVVPRPPGDVGATTLRSSAMEELPPSWEEEDGGMDPDRMSAVSTRSMPLEKLLQRVQDKREDARRQRRRRNWREWSSADWDNALAAPTDAVVTKEPRESHVAVRLPSDTPNETNDELLSLAATTQPPQEHGHCQDTACGRVALAEAAVAGETQQQRENLAQSSVPAVVLPPIKFLSPPLDRPHSGETTLPTQPSLSSRGLSRSESAPTTLDGVGPVRSRAKVYRGLHKALDLEPSDEHHVARDRGLSIFHKHCEYVNKHSPSRIRYAKTELALATVNAARIQSALGRRDANHKTPPKSSLLRRERHTIERATAALTHSEHTRVQRHDAALLGCIRKSNFNVKGPT